MGAFEFSDALHKVLSVINTAGKDAHLVADEVLQSIDLEKHRNILISGDILEKVLRSADAGMASVVAKHGARAGVRPAMAYCQATLHLRPLEFLKELHELMGPVDFDATMSGTIMHHLLDQSYEPEAIEFFASIGCGVNDCSDFSDTPLSAILQSLRHVVLFKEKERLIDKAVTILQYAPDLGVKGKHSLSVMDLLRRESVQADFADIKRRAAAMNIIRSATVDASGEAPGHAPVQRLRI